MIPIPSAQRRQLVTAVAVVSSLLCAYTFFHLFSGSEYSAVQLPTPPSSPENGSVTTGGPMPKAAPGRGHPISYLISDAEHEFQEMKKRQSQSLNEAVVEYRRRYKMPPPPHFDKWFEFAKVQDVQMVDEFDTIHDLITPFWALKPETIRARAREALGFDNGLIGVAIRDQKVAHMQGEPEWQRNMTSNMLARIVKYLPDMDLAFNIYDEPRVILSHEDLARLRHKAKEETIPAAFSAKSPINKFSKTPADLNDGKSFKETTLTRFNSYAHQPTWSDSRVSCPPNTPARCLEEDERQDERSRYGIGELGFVYNTTAMSDICLTPSLSSTYGFFDAPNTYQVVRDLFPIFSQSKFSSYGDLIYPSPWYWSNMVTFKKEKDVGWSKKQNKLYWRGSTTGGYSRNGRWRRQHRQRFVQNMNAPDQAKIMVNQGTAEQPDWQVKVTPRGDYRDLVDVHFSHVGQCDEGDCAAQTEFFQVAEYADQQTAWNFKYLLDMDGNAFSGRFYAFLRSSSLVFKLAISREWHAEWLRPWVHYIPLSMQGDDWLEAARYFNDEENANKAEKIASTSQEWANKAIRHSDMEAWFFRLLLEYARVIDDDRANIGFAPWGL